MTPRDENMALCLADDTTRAPIEVEIGIFLAEVNEFLVEESDRVWFDHFNSDPDFRARLEDERRRDLEQAEADLLEQTNIARAAGF